MPPKAETAQEPLTPTADAAVKLDPRSPLERAAMDALQRAPNWINMENERRARKEEIDRRRQLEAGGVRGGVDIQPPQSNETLSTPPPPPKAVYDRASQQDLVPPGWWTRNVSDPFDKYVRQPLFKLNDGTKNSR